MSLLPAITIGLLSVTQLGPLTHTGSLTDNLRAPARIAVAPDGTVLVTDPFYNHIARFDGVGTPLGTWPVSEGPVGIAAHSDGRYFVSLRDLPKVGIYEVIGGVFTRTGFLGEGNPPVTFVGPTDIDVQVATGRIFVVDSAADQIYAFESNGDLAWVTGINGELSGEFQYPSAIGVDEAAGRLIVADQDNFRLQILDTDGMFQQSFGYRIKYLPDWFQEGWTVRTLGVDIDADSHIYVVDAIMSTVRIFDATGIELGRVVDYGSSPGDIRTPTDLALSNDGAKLYVVSTNTSSVEVYQTPTFTARSTQDAESTPSIDAKLGAKGTNACAYDTQRGVAIGRASSSSRAAKTARKRAFGRLGENSGADADTSATNRSNGFDGPHMIDATIICGRCHSIDGQPGGHEGLVEGQSVLCMSCHNSAGQALDSPIHELDIADPFSTNPNAADGRGRSHAWGVPAVNTAADSVGPTPGGEMELYLDAGGNMKCSTCHNQHNSDSDAPYLRVNNRADAMCKQCHAPRNKGPGEGGTHAVGFDYPGGVGEFPTDDLLAPLVLKENLVECSTCHAPHYADSGGANAGEGDGMLLREANDGTLCKTCHADHIGHTSGGSWQPTCVECHGVHDPDNPNLSLVAATVRNQTLGADKPVVFTARAGANSFDDGDPAANDGICQVCHTATTYHKHDGSGVPHNDGATCTACHPHDAGFMPTGGSSCIACHSQPQDNGDGVPVGGRAIVVNADGTGAHHFGSGVLTDGDCTVCHDMSQHQQGKVRLIDPNDPGNPAAVVVLNGDPSTDPVEANKLVPFCGGCHAVPIVHTPAGSWQPACTECHALHDPANVNLFYVEDTVRNQTLGADMPVVFTARQGPNSFDDGDPTKNDGVCQVCHTGTSYHTYNGAGAVHNDGLDCTTCHPHDAGFMPTGGDCTVCHASPQDNGDGIPAGGRRAVVDEFGYSSHHLQGASLDPADCEACHEMSQHQQGAVRLKNVDDPANPGAVIALAGDPATNSVEALKLEAFCLACHDNDGASGAAPFTDGNMPPVIDSAAWTNASHSVGGVIGRMTCFGDGETFGCHSTGHGSAKLKLLAPADASQPPVTGDALREEEGMCYTCHDADGPASTNVAGMFAQLNHHNVSSVDQADGSLIECTSCHNPHTASALTRLIDPDSDGSVAWAGNGVDFCLTCHDGAPPAGVSFPIAAASGTGYDKSAYAGSTHAAQLGVDSCRHCHQEHGSQFVSMLKNQYNMADYNSYSTGDGDFAACWVCHNENAVVQQDNAYENLHKKHVVGENAPCFICHDTHGAFDAGEEGLINFDTSVQLGYDIQYINQNDGSSSFWLDLGQNQGFCLIQCHGKNHTPKSYNRITATTVDCTACHAFRMDNGDSLPP